MLKSIPTARSECTAKYETRLATAQTTLFLIRFTFLALFEKRSKDRLKKEIFVKNIVLTKNC